MYSEVLRVSNSRLSLPDVARSAYNTLVRPRTRRKIRIHNGVAVKNIHLFDYDEIESEHKQEFLNPLADAIKSGDTVVQIGGGFGVSTVVAAEEAGPDGTAITYEASENNLKTTRETIQINAKSWRETADVDLRHGLVGDDIAVAGELGDVETIPVSDLPSSDILALDCEGAESSILPKLTTQPQTLIVETHGWLGADTGSIEEIIVGKGYEIKKRIPQREEKDNFVLVATCEND